MANRETLVIPAGVHFDLKDEGVSIEYAGDILLQGDHQRPVGRVVSSEGSVQISGNMTIGRIESPEGSVTISGEVTVAEVKAAKRVVLDGNVEFGAIEGENVEIMGGTARGSLLKGREGVDLRGNVELSNVKAKRVGVNEGSLRAKALEGSESISLGSADLQVDVVIAPTVNVDPQTVGRVAVLESDNPLGPNGIRGAFRLDEFAQFTGQDAEAFLFERGVGEGAPSPDIEMPEAPAAEEEPEEWQEDSEELPTLDEELPDFGDDGFDELPAEPPAMEELPADDLGLEELPADEPANEELPSEEPVADADLPEWEEAEELEEPEEWGAIPEPTAEEKLDGWEEPPPMEEDDLPEWEEVPAAEPAADDDIPAWDAAPADDEIDDEIPAWDAAPADDDIPEWDESPPVMVADDDIPAWDDAPTAAVVEDDEIPAWDDEPAVRSGGAAQRSEPAVMVEVAEDAPPPVREPEIPQWTPPEPGSGDEEEPFMRLHSSISTAKHPPPVLDGSDSRRAPKPRQESAPPPVRVAVDNSPKAAPPPKQRPAQKPASPAKPAREKRPTAKIKSPLHQELITTVDSIVACYDGVETPPAIEQLRSLIVEGKFKTVKAEIANIWNNLLKHHQRTGTRLQHQVTTTFNTVNTLVRKIK